MADVKVSALTALTGANLANGDQFLVTDVGSPNVSKSITADELAQGSQFSSRYVPRSGDTLWIPAAAWGPVAGSPTLGTPNALFLHSAWLLDASSDEELGTSTLFPTWWATFHIDLYFVNAGAGSGDIMLYSDATFAGSGESLNAASVSFGGGTIGPITMGARSVVVINRLASSVTIQSGEMFAIRVSRFASNVGDTLGNDVGLVGMLLTRAS
jgi:hypothetical protein